jgi:hypothetical protein
MSGKHRYRFLKSGKHRTVALILCLAGGWLGLHYFYVRRYRRAAVNLFLLLILAITTNIFGLRYFVVFRNTTPGVFVSWREAAAVLSAGGLGVMWILDLLTIIQSRFKDSEGMTLK